MWSFISPVVYTYFVYPLITIGMAKRKEVKKKEKEPIIPKLSILIAAHNEELVIESKIKSILSSKYPIDEIEIIIGTDNCTDNTDKIIQGYANHHKVIKHVKFEKRSGKIKIINALFDKALGEILVLTDANVLFTEHTLSALIQHFSDSKIGLVDSNMQNYGLKTTGISIPEKTYMILIRI